MDVSKNSGFSPQIIHGLIGVFHLFSPSILGETPLIFGNIQIEKRLIQIDKVCFSPGNLAFGVKF